MFLKRKHPIDYGRAKVRQEILIRQRRELWTPEQVKSLACHFRLRPGKSLLDVGCGFGYALRTWGRYCLPGGTLVGLDRDKRLLSTAKRLCRREGLADCSEFVQGDVYTLPFSANRFHTTLAHVVFCHLDKPERALDEMIRVTRRGGCVVVFDNALGDGMPTGWYSWSKPTVRQLLLDYEFNLRWQRGRRKLGRGDMSVGCYIPGWMEARDMRDVGVRMNERVRWMAPPYRSPEQRTQRQSALERNRERVRWDRLDKREKELVKAGGLSRRKYLRREARARVLHRAWRKELRDRTASFAGSSPFWCIWGFKP